MINTKEKNFYTKPLNILFIAILANFLWGSAFPAIKMGYEYFNIQSDDIPTQLIFAGIRFIFAGIMVGIFNSISAKKIIIPKRKDLKGIFLLGIVQTALEYIFFYISLVNLSGVKGSIINAMGNFFAVILAHFAFKNDRMTKTKAIGCLLGFAGIVICNVGGEGIDASFKITGEGFMIIAAFCFASGGIITKIFAKDTEPTVLTSYQLTLGGLILLIIGVIMNGKLIFNGISCVLILIYLSALSAIAFSLWAKLLKFNPVGKISLFGFLNPIFGVILSGLILNENFFDIKLIVALACVSGGIYIVNYSKSSKTDL